ncbi:FkbM family methyltransferase [Lipingzhangella sp. LS1_29]|uniref:FkbM family methyltransferase n=1 Tax=Lipingzhangella rawalii TaxID=2055835 RepID=A0ABU2H9Y2_9ACTN|nr:FkbM family methyltransferase [Lipingzhangella rawalii]MDS1272123.1 FkbM family methyltransferase [Lipingzhangella rawalii]
MLPDPDPVRAFVRRHPAVREATRRIRVHLPERFGGIDPARLPPRVRRFELPLPRRGVTPPHQPDAIRVEAPGDLWLPRHLQRGGLAGYEPESLACFLAAVEHARSGAVLDVGANIGIYSALAAARSDRAVFSFEPTVEVATVARTIAEENGLDYTVLSLALSNHTGTAALRLSAISDASNSLATGHRPEIGRREVEVDTLAHWRERQAVVPAIVKIDTEATEPEVLAGALELLRSFRPWIFCEVRPALGVAERLMALLEPHHYVWFHLEGAPPYAPRTTITAREDHHSRLWLFAPGMPPAHFWDAAAEWRTALADC